MGNVIVGIMAVILFIGLAAAGAVYLGGGITGARASTNAARIIAGLQQVAGATRMYAQKSKGAHLPNDPTAVPTLLAGGFLRSTPTNPISGAENSAYVTDSSGQQGSTRPTFVQMTLGGDDTSMRACIEMV